MSDSLQQRATAFLERPIPDGMAFAPGSMAERFIAAYASDGKLDVDAEMGELLSICVMEAEFAVDGKSGEEAAYMRESFEILAGILEEVQSS